MRYTTVQDGLTLALAYVKNWLKVDDSTDDTLIGDLIDIAKETADNYLQNDFKTVRDEEVGIGDDSTAIFTLGNNPVADRSLALYILDDGVDSNDAAFNPRQVGSLMVQAEDDIDNDYALNLTSGVITFVTNSIPDNGETVYAYRYRVTTAMSVPGTVKMGVLKMIAYLYEQRTGGVKSEQVRGLGAVNMSGIGSTEIPPDVIALWASYRKNPGL